MPTPPSTTVSSQEGPFSPTSSILISDPMIPKESIEPSSEASIIVSEPPNPVEHSSVVRPSSLPRKHTPQDSKVAALVKQSQPPPKAIPGSPNHSRQLPIVLVSESEAEPERAPLMRSRSK